MQPLLINTLMTLTAAELSGLGMDEAGVARVLSENAYRSAMKEWNSYKAWKTNRNPERALLEEKFGYDCYAADTEFLTASGWQLFDNIEFLV